MSMWVGDPLPDVELVDHEGRPWQIAACRAPSRRAAGDTDRRRSLGVLVPWASFCSSLPDDRNVFDDVDARSRATSLRTGNSRCSIEPLDPAEWHTIVDDGSVLEGLPNDRGAGLPTLEPSSHPCPQRVGPCVIWESL